MAKNKPNSKSKHVSTRSEIVDILDVDLIKKTREGMGLSLAEAAKRAGMFNRTSWWQVENQKGFDGGRGITMERLIKIGRALKKQPRDLLKTIKL